MHGVHTEGVCGTKLDCGEGDDGIDDVQDGTDANGCYLDKASVD